MKISGFIISMLIISLIVISVYSFVEDLSSDQSFNTQNIDMSYKTTYDKIDALNSNVNNTQQKLLDINPKENTNFFTGTWDVMVLTKEVVFGAVGVTGSSIGIGTSLMGSFAEDLEMELEISSIITALLTVAVIGALIFLITKRRW